MNHATYCLVSQDYEQHRADRENQKPGSLKGYDCPLCKNRGRHFFVDEAGNLTSRPCQCMGIREALKEMKRSRLPEELLKTCSFPTYQTPNKLTTIIKNIAWIYAQEPKGWLYIGGQSGSGKTHICTAVVNSLIKEKGLPVLYMRWNDDVREIKALANDPAGIEKLNRFKQIKVLYIDDLFKGGISDADKKICFELLNYRANANISTIISSELTVEDLLGIDEAIGGRIKEMAVRPNCITISKDKSKNWRLTHGDN